MAQNKYGVQAGKAIQEEADSEAMRIIGERAGALAVAIHRQGASRMELVMGISLENDTYIGDWHILIERVDNRYMVQ